MPRAVDLIEPLDLYDAVAIAEGFYDGPLEVDEELTRQAWQQLQDTRLAYKLQGWFGRTAQRLIQEGFIHE